MRELSRVMVMFYTLVGAWVTQVHAFVKTQPTYTGGLCVSLHVNFTSTDFKK